MAKWLVEDVLEHKDLPLTIATNEVLWSIMPKDVIFKYVRDEALKEKARALIKEGKYCQSMQYKPDRNFKHELAFFLNQMNYRKMCIRDSKYGVCVICMVVLLQNGHAQLGVDDDLALGGLQLAGENL